jgi:hypothetical protein
MNNSLLLTLIFASSFAIDKVKISGRIIDNEMDL